MWKLNIILWTVNRNYNRIVHNPNYILSPELYEPYFIATYSLPFHAHFMEKDDLYRLI